MTTPSRGARKDQIGTVVSDRMDKTVVVRVLTLKQHPMYKKVVRRASKFKVHDEANQCSTGDVVRIMETRPLSREKRWRVVEIVEKAK